MDPRLLIFSLLLLFQFTGVFASPLEIKSEQAHIRTIMPRDHFAVDARMRKNVDFWIEVYSRYTTRQGLIHDAKYIDKVYQVIDVSGPGAQSVRGLKRKWREILLSVHKKQSRPETLTEDERKVFALYADVNEPNKFLNAAHRKRLRFQLGQRDRFLQGLKMSGRYLPTMEEIFRREGLPVQLTRLPFVESSFNVNARSKVGASGIWQFMRSTGRLFLKINEAVDERNDPIRATEAAARLLRQNFESLGKWPLAVTAYNHGRKGMMRAVRTVGSEELEDLVGSYRGRTFGFASSNFFTELLAAIEVERNAEKYFGKVERDSALATYEVSLPDFVDLRQLVSFLKLDRSAIKQLNPGISEAVYTGVLLLPAGYRLRLPMDEKLGPEASARVFMAGYEQIPAMFKLQGQKYGKYAKRRSHSF